MAYSLELLVFYGLMVAQSAAACASCLYSWRREDQALQAGTRSETRDLYAPA